jgi:hypothetical protein
MASAKPRPVAVYAGLDNVEEIETDDYDKRHSE